MKKVFCFLAAGMLLLSGCAAGEKSPVPTATARTAPTAAAAASTAAPPASTPAAAEYTLPEALREGGTAVLSVYDVQSGQLRDMAAEDYLACVVAGEMPVDFPQEALRAQAVVARTFLVKFLQDKGGSVLHPGADISTDIEESQAFAEDQVTQDVIRAVEETRGMILTHEGQAIYAWFHAASGGRTATAKEGLSFDREPTPYIVSVESEESSAPAEIARWEASFAKEEVVSAIESVTGKRIDFDEVQMGEAGESGRVSSLIFSGVEVSANALRIALGSTKFRSTLLESVTYAKDTLTLAGSGYGHGVGMSQWGAAQRAQEGEDFASILAHYYPGTELTRAWE